jgi:hypothetical protein
MEIGGFLMQVFYSPQLNLTDTLTYEFIGEKVIANLNGETDEFDFTDFPDGEVSVGGREDNITTTLPICPLIRAKKENGVLYVTLLNYIGKDASYEERFPDWIEV